MKTKIKNCLTCAAAGKSRTILISILAATVIISAAIGIVVGVVRNSYDVVSPQTAASHTIIRAACRSTRFPDLCFEAVAAATEVKSSKEVITTLLNVTIAEVQRSYFKVVKLRKRKGLSVRETTALHDCLETIDETLDELHEAYRDLEIYPKKKSLAAHAEDLKTLLSAAMTNRETCLDGFSHDVADKKLRAALEGRERRTEKMCSNVLAMVVNLTETDIAAAGGRDLTYHSAVHGGRKLLDWPGWMSVADRKLMQSSTIKPNVVVAADGSGNFRTVSAAVAAAPSNSKTRYVIRIKAGVYRENVDVPKSKTNLMFLGDGRTTTIITASRNVVDGSTTFHSATVAAVGANFLARDITFQNTAGPSKHQAVALRVGSDLSAFYRCDMLAYQDTLYVHSNRQFYSECLIAGTVDFIFGNAAAVLQNCDIHARRPNSGQKNMVTAQGRTDPNQNTGIVIQKSRIGAGAATGGRVKWKGFRVITSVTEAQRFTPGSFLGGSNWLASTGFEDAYLSKMNPPRYTQLVSTPAPFTPARFESVDEGQSQRYDQADSIKYSTERHWHRKLFEKNILKHYEYTERHQIIVSHIIIGLLSFIIICYGLYRFVSWIKKRSSAPKLTVEQKINIL